MDYKKKMKTTFLASFVITGVICLSQFVLINAEPISGEEFMKTYQPILDRVYSENLPPQKQLQIGMLMRDVVCFDDGKIRILKIASFNQVSCVSPETAQKLVDRGWGLMHREDPNTGKGGSECTNWWIIHHDGTNKPSLSKLLKILRLTTNKFSDEYVVWSPIQFVQSTGKTITLESHGSFYPEQELMIKQNLNDIESVLGVEFEPRACI